MGGVNGYDLNVSRLMVVAIFKYNNFYVISFLAPAWVEIFKLIVIFY